MITLIEILIFFATLIIIGTIYWYWTIPKNLPPGPLGLPLLGSTLDYLEGPKQHLKIQEDVKKYGPLYKVYIANKLVIILGDYETIHKAMVKNGDAFAGRPEFFQLFPDMGKYGVVFNEGEIWKENRRFALSTLRDFGVGRPILEPKIKEEVENLMEIVDGYAKHGESFNPQRLLMCAVVNVISFLIFDKRFDYDDNEFMDRFLAISALGSENKIGLLSPLVLCEKLGKFLKYFPMVEKMKKTFVEFFDYTENEIKKTMATYDPESEPTNFIHAFMKAAADKKVGTFHDKQLLATSIDIFGAGADTTATTLRWAIFFLVHHPGIQEKMYQEIKEHVGTHVLPDYGDRLKLPLTEAVIMETQRASSILPLGMPRKTLEPVKIMGYDIPQDAIIIPMTNNIFQDEKLYPDPTKFDPTRFLDSNGKVIRDPKLIPFQIGKRSCLGEPLARMELFFFLVGFVSRFHFYFPENEEKPTMEPVIAMNSSPVPFKICVKSRND